MGDTSSQIGTDMEDRARAELIEEYFSSTGVGAPEVEGFLWLKAEGKKTWKKFYFVLRTSGLYYAPKGKKTSKDLVCLARFDVNQVYFGVKWQPKFKAPSKHCFAIKHPQIQAKNPKYIRYLCADSELELNKWVTGIRLAKYGKGLYDNYRKIIEDIAHEDIDRLASARLSVNSTKSTSSSQEDQIPMTTTTVIVHSSHNGGVHCRSSRSSSTTSGRSESSSLHNKENNCSSSSVEQGFSCDSPEGGTIKKKPSAAKGALVTFKPSEGKCNNNKEVRFKDTYSTIPNEDEVDIGIPAHREQTYATMRRGSTPTNFNNPYLDNPNEKSVYNNIENILNNHRLTLDRHGLPDPPHPIRRRYSNESLVSNPQMLHSGTLVPTEQPTSVQVSPQLRNKPPHVAPKPAPPIGPKPGNAPPVSPKPQMSIPVSPPEPQRPAPVLKPQVSRKPSVDKSVLLKKQQQICDLESVSKPTYEDTLKKCQSLMEDKKPPSPQVPPKPSLANRALASAKLDNSQKISHLPPTGLNRANKSNKAIKINVEDPEIRPFPNRFSSGEYENASAEQQIPQQQRKINAPPLPKRNDETHLSWNRS